MDSARAAVFAVTCSTDAADSLIEDTICSVEAPTEAACPAVSLRETAVSFRLPVARSSVRTCTSESSATSSVTRERAPAAVLTDCACERTSCESNCGAIRVARPFIFRDAMTCLLCVPFEHGIADREDRLEVQQQDQSVANVGHAFEITSAQPGQRGGRRMNRGGIDRGELARAVDHQADGASAGVDHQQPRGEIVGGAFGAEPRAQG